MDKLSGNSADNSADFFENYTKERSAEIRENAMLAVFNRMRVVEKLFLSEHQKDDEKLGLGKEELQKYAKEKIKTEDELVKDSIEKNLESFSQDYELNPEWHAIYDYTDEVINDGVNWYLVMRESFNGNEIFLKSFFKIFNRKLFQESSADKPATKGDFAGEVIALMANRFYEVRPTKKVRGKKKDEHEAILKDISVKGGETEAKFIKALERLSPEFNRLYREQMSS